MEKISYEENAALKLGNTLRELRDIFFRDFLFFVYARRLICATIF